MNDDNRTPVFSPIIALLKSRKVMVAIATLVANVIVVAIPALLPVQTELLIVLTALGGVLMGAIAYEDGAAKR